MNTLAFVYFLLVIISPGHHTVFGDCFIRDLDKIDILQLPNINLRL